MQVLLQVLTLFLLMMCGLTAVKTHLMDDRGVSGVNMLVLYFAQPCLIVAKMQCDSSPELIRDLGLVFLLGCVAMAVSGTIGYLIFRRQPQSRRSVFASMSMMSNCGFMGYPVITAALGEGALIYAVAYVAAFNLMSWTLGAFFLGGAKAMRPRELIRNPSLIAVVVGLTLFLTGWRLPDFITGGMEMLGDTTTPLAMFVIGAKLISLRKEHLTDKPLLFTCMFRLVLFPLCLLAVLRLTGLPDMVVSALYLCTAMPCAALTAMQADLYRCDSALASRGVALSTAFSMATIPLLLMLV